MVRQSCVLRILISKCPSHHNDAQCCISHRSSYLRTRRFREHTFRPYGDTNHWKNNSVSQLSYLFAHLHLLSSDSFSSLILSLLIFLFSLPLPCSAFHLSILSEVCLLNFLRQFMPYHHWKIPTLLQERLKLNMPKGMVFVFPQTQI